MSKSDPWVEATQSTKRKCWIRFRDVSAYSFQETVGSIPSRLSIMMALTPNDESFVFSGDEARRVLAILDAYRERTHD
jgi:hypothetical protein